MNERLLEDLTTIEEEDPLLLSIASYTGAAAVHLPRPPPVAKKTLGQEEKEDKLRELLEELVLLNMETDRLQQMIEFKDSKIASLEQKLLRLS